MNNNSIIEVLRKSKVAHLNTHLFETEKKQRQPRKISKHVLWMGEQLKDWCEAKGYELLTEYKFHEYRKWKIDFFIVDINTGIEYEGIMSGKSRHTTKLGYSGDTDKYREAVKMGILILRYTVMNFKNILSDLDSLIEKSS